MVGVATKSDQLFAPARPLALVAEDNVALRENTVRMLERRGVAAIPVGSFQQAANALTVSPRVDVALLDIHLDIDKAADDKGGIAIARLLRSSTSTLKIIGYSGKFREEQLTSDEVHLFDETCAKGALSHEDHVRLWDRCAELAQENYQLRRDVAQDHLEQLRRLYETEVPEVEVLRRLQMDDPTALEFTAEGALGLAGYKVRVLQLSDRIGRRSHPIVVWEQVVSEDKTEWYNVEVYSHSDLYSTGITEAEALESLAEYIALTTEDLGRYPDLSPAEKRLQGFLQGLFV